MPGEWCFEYRCKIIILRETQFRVSGSKELLCVNGLGAVLRPGSGWNGYSIASKTIKTTYAVFRTRLVFEAVD
ncbi:hypothetical protein TESG_08412 [Trichophyton tonsurans CBS 112818]|uniref:Uncharacterized protein n=1 Tax=Trichophyton tonsurans (strain CBS 112818) TaxID=647933 RepID=F2RWY0_TRIT1|nr:hypothetical protein TESG_08412 [Trichophyton tonsurans CBS 112818]